MDWIAPYLLGWSFAFALITAAELLLPRGPERIGNRLAGLGFWALWLPVSALVHAGYQHLWHWLGVAPLVVLPLDFTWTGIAAVVLAPLAGALVYDFFFYWCHRAQHRWLWRYHAVHHAIRDLNAVNAYHHISEPLLQAVLILLPTSLIVSDTGQSAAAMVVLLHLHASYIHSPVRFGFGPVGRLFVDNRYHRIHHSLEERHFDRNFAAFTPLWDWLFGTIWFPRRGEWPAVGLAEADQPRDLREWLTLPWRPRAPQEEPAAPLRPQDRAAAASG
ncbi:sterol desaturase family protein [Sphingomonas canadensis]|uniref:Sterol desaturase family protein n=1 Tax=Sphingomonas canadensis TaxID=1219257 RepID=A0ABW3H9H2_9SPHN|nr:sterol desaturase family protein [Sphingomonas canadensis]MCW3837769.1 sterol desaturase family protein [Sphingomonas canadensis]